MCREDGRGRGERPREKVDWGGREIGWMRGVREEASTDEIRTTRAKQTGAWKLEVIGTDGYSMPEKN